MSDMLHVNMMKIRTAQGHTDKALPVVFPPCEMPDAFSVRRSQGVQCLKIPPVLC